MRTKSISQLNLRLLLLPLLFVFGICEVIGQDVQNAVNIKQKVLKYQRVNVGIGVDNDRFHDMSLNQLMAISKNPQDLYRDLSGFDEEIRSSATGLALYVSRSFDLWSPRQNSYSTNRELRLGFGFHSPKESLISYKNADLDTSIVYCNMHGEFTFEGAYLQKGSWGKKGKLLWYWGGGMNASVSFSNEMIIISGKYFTPGAHPSTQESLEENRIRFLAKPVTYVRFYVPYGLHYKVSKKTTIGLDLRRGFGVQSILGGSSNFISKTNSFALGVNWHI